MSTAKSKKGIEQALNLPDIEQLQKMLNLTPELSTEIEFQHEMSLVPEIENISEENAISLEEAKSALKRLKELRVQLKDLPDITTRKAHLNRMADMAEQKFADIFDRAINCEDKYMTEMINAATNMMKVALEAHTRILEADIKLVDLQIKKDKIELDFNNRPQAIPQQSERDIHQHSDGEVTTSINRNDLLGSSTQNK